MKNWSILDHKISDILLKKIYMTFVKGMFDKGYYNLQVP